MIKDKFLTEITGKKWFTDEEYPLLKEQYKNELAQKYAENPPSPPSPPSPPPVDKVKLQKEKTKLQGELNILQTQGFDALQKFRERESITNRIAKIDEQLI